MENAQVVDSGKFIFMPKNESLPMLPEMNVLIFKHSDNNEMYTHSAVCIELEIDACGNSAEEACQELEKVIDMYLESQAQQSESIEAFAKSIIEIAFSKSRQKEALFELYRKVKQKHLLDMAQKNVIQYPSLTKNELHYSPVFSSSLNKQEELSPARAMV